MTLDLTWTIRRTSGDNAVLYLDFDDDGIHTCGETAVTGIVAVSDAATIEREAGAFSLEGYEQASSGAARFTPNADFVAALEARGFRPRPKDVLALGMFDAPLRDVDALRRVVPDIRLRTIMAVLLFGLRESDGIAFARDLPVMTEDELLERMMRRNMLRRNAVQMKKPPEGG